MQGLTPVTPAVFPRRLRRWRCIALAVLATLSLPAAAQSLRCGTFKDADSGAVLRVESSAQARLELAGQAAEPYHLQHDGDQLLAANLASGRTSTLSVSADGRYLNDDAAHYALEGEAACQPPPTFAPGSCRADITTCMGQMVWAGADSWRQWCAQGIPVACDRLIEDYRSDARSAWVIAKVMADPTIPSSVPPVCQQDNAAFDADACRAADDKDRVQAVGKAFSITREMPKEPLLPAAQLDEVEALCRQHPSGAFCTAVALALRTAGRLPAARAALQLACSPGNDPQACAQRDADDRQAPAAPAPR